MSLATLTETFTTVGDSSLFFCGIFSLWCRLNLLEVVKFFSIPYSTCLQISLKRIRSILT